MTPTKGRRKSISARSKLIVTLRELGLTVTEIQFDHDPALSARKWNERKGDFEPPQDDPRFIKLLMVDRHKVKTFGPGGTKRIHTRGSDISEPRRIERIAERHKEFCRTALAPKKRKPAKAKKAGRAWPKRTFARKGQPHG